MNIRDAEAAIAAILQRLESDTDAVVDSVKLVDVENTTMNDDRRRFFRRVLINLHRLPGHDWSPAPGPAE
jgi:hypothetical protein